MKIWSVSVFKETEHSNSLRQTVPSEEPSVWKSSLVKEVKQRLFKRSGIAGSRECHPGKGIQVDFSKLFTWKATWGQLATSP